MKDDPLNLMEFCFVCRRPYTGGCCHCGAEKGARKKIESLEAEVVRLQSMKDTASHNARKYADEAYRLEEQLAMGNEAYESTMAEVGRCVHEESERHCTCVPHLRVEVIRLTKALAEIRDLVNDISGILGDTDCK